MAIVHNRYVATFFFLLNTSVKVLCFIYENCSIHYLCKCINPLFCNAYRSVFTNRQIIRLQESPDMMPAGQTPHTVVMVCYDDQVEMVQPGDRLEGIYSI